MKKFLISACVAVGCIFNMNVLPASAAQSETLNGVDVSISSDKETYKSTDEINVSLNVENENSYYIQKAEAEITIPEGVELNSGVLTNENIYLAPNSSFLNRIMIKSTADLTEKPRELSAVTTALLQKNSPKTGDDNSVQIAVILALAALIAVVLARPRKIKKFFCLFLCLNISLSFCVSGFEGLDIAYAEAVNEFTVAVSKTINVEGKEYEISAKVTVNADSYLTKEEIDAYQEAINNLSPDADSDGDGISDADEYKAGYNFFRKDSDFDGISDADEDLDGDGLSNGEEVKAGTLIYNSDTDDDGLTDYEEVKLYHTDPLIADSDGDGLDDYDENKLNLDPLNTDTDGDGINDSAESFAQEYKKSFIGENGRGIKSVSVSLDTVGNIEKDVSITNTYDFDLLSRDVVGLVGIPVEIKAKNSFEKATLKFEYDDTAIGNVDEDKLSVLWYDKENDWYQVLDRESVVDTENNTVTVETTHFSTYMLVNTDAWYDAWRENIDYSISNNGDKAITSFDIAFVVDTSGSMTGSNIQTAKNALKSFVSSMVMDSDAAAVISFNSSATLIQNFIYDESVLNNAINLLSAGGQTNVNSGLLKALDCFDGRVNSNEKVIVLICDGDVNYSQTTIDRCKAEGIRIFAINVQYASTHVTLQKMADETGGLYFYCSTNDEFSTMLGQIQNVTVDRINPEDSDGDGLYDIYETAGIKLPNGKVVYTDPAKKDTDGDNLTDFQETGIIYNVDDRYIGNLTSKKIKYFRMKSDPSIPDTDFDKINDDVDSDPLNVNEVEINLSNRFSGCQYLNISGLNGGNQGWWHDPVTDPEFSVVFSQDVIDRIANMGCGLIAMTDIELFFAQQNPGYTLYNSYSFNDITSPPDMLSYNSTTGEIAKSDYMHLAMYNVIERYSLTRAAQSLTGVYPWDMMHKFEDFLRQNNSSWKKAVWAPHSPASRVSQKADVLSDIERMLKDNLPVVFAYNNSESITMYETLNKAVSGDISNASSCKSHYMTIIGLVKKMKNDGSGYDSYLKVVSWGEIYYLRYDDYAKSIDPFSNILLIK